VGTGLTPGDKLATAQLVKADSNATNNQDSALATLLLTCGAAFSNGTACPSGFQFNASSSNTLIANATQSVFNRSCCVSANAAFALARLEHAFQST
jgi:hypothetical protein